jgi:ketosteroid isomerase-like protein
MRYLPLLLAIAAGAGPLPAQAPLPQPPRGPAAYVLLAPLEADQLIAAVRAAEAERLDAIKAVDPVRLESILSDDLRYAHSNGKVDTKDSLIKSLVDRSMVYESFDYREINFRAASPGIVLMTGRVVIHASSAGQKAVLDLNFLAVWRQENGRWRFLAWQSARNPPPPAQ